MNILAKIPLNTRLYEALSNIFLVIFMKDNERIRTKSYYICLVTLYFMQICGFMSSLSQKASIDTYVDYLLSILENTRLLPILSRVQIPYLSLILLLLIFLFEAFFIYCIFILSFSKIKDDCDVIKRRQQQIGFTQLFLEHQKWFYCLVKLDLIFGAFYCSSQNGPVQSKRCSSNIQFDGSSIITSGLYYLLIFLILITTALIQALIAMIYHNPEFSAVNLLKSRYSTIKSYEILLEFLLVLTSYSSNPIFVFLIANIFCIFLFAEYYMHFPLMDKKISDIYGCMILIAQSFTIMFALREYSSFIADKNFVQILLVLTTLCYGVVKTMWNKKLIMVMTIDAKLLSKSPSDACLYFEKLCDLFEQNFLSKIQKLTLFGALQLHKNSCYDLICPCKDEEINEISGKFLTVCQEVVLITAYDITFICLKQQHVIINFLSQLYLKGEAKPTISGGMIIDLGNVIKLRGVDFSRICIDENIFQIWFNNFIDFQFEKLISNLIKQRQEQMAQEVCLRYWFFLIKFKKNQIKALFQSKIMTTLILKKNSFFQTVEKSMTNLIESQIKEKDKAYSYSYRQKDRLDSVNNTKFDKLVTSEEIRSDIKIILGNAIQSKISLLELMIKGFQNVEDLRLSVLKFITSTEETEAILIRCIQQNGGNLYFLKMHSILRSKVLYDPTKTKQIESYIDEIISHDKTLDTNQTITCTSILNGHVGSIVASFKNQNEGGKILKFSEKVPQLFGYDRGEFQQKSRITDLMPDCISSLHGDFLKRLIETGTPRTVRTYRTMFAKNKNGHIFLVKLFINYYFMKQDDFAFSGLLIKISTKNQYVTLNRLGYIEDLSQNFIQTIQGNDVDIGYFKQCHISIFIPSFIEFILEYDPTDEYLFVKYKLDIPKDISSFMSKFIQTHQIKEYLELDSPSDNWLKDIKSFRDQSKQKQSSFECTMNIRVEQFEGINKKNSRLIIVEIENLIPWDDMTCSNTLSVTSRSKKSMASSANEEGTNVEIMVNQKSYNVERNQTNMFQAETINFDKKQEEDKLWNFDHQIPTIDDRNEKQPINNLNPPKLIDNSQLDQSLNLTQQPMLQQLQLSSIGNEQGSDDGGGNLYIQQRYDQLDELNNTQNNQDEDRAQGNIEKQQSSQANRDSQMMENQLTMGVTKNVLQSKKVQKKQSVSSDDDSNMNKLKSVSVSEHKDINIIEKNQASRRQNNPNEGSQPSNSVSTSSSTSLRRILTNCEQKDTPQFILLLYAVFSFQFIVFSTVVLVLIVTISQNITAYSKDVVALKNQGFLIRPYDNFDQFIDYNLVLNYYEYTQTLFEILQQQVFYQYQREFLKYDIQTILLMNGERGEYPIKFTEYLKMMGKYIYTFSQVETITISREDKANILSNYDKVFYQCVQNQGDIEIDLVVLRDSIVSVNNTSVAVAVVLIISSFGFIVPSFTTLKFNSQRILMVISRMTQMEAENIINGLKQVKLDLFDVEDKYLHINYSYIEECDFDQIALTEQSHRNKKSSSQSTKKKKSNHLNDRITNQRLQFTKFLLILLTLCFLSIAFFLVVFLYMDSFSNTFGKPASDYRVFLEAVMQFSSVVSSHNSLIIEEIATSNNVKFVNLDIIQGLTDLRNKNFDLSRTFFSTQYSDIYMNSASSTFKQNMYGVNAENACTTGILTTTENQLCNSNLQGILSKGLSQTVTNILNRINVQKDSTYENLVKDEDYVNYLIESQLVIKVMKGLIAFFEDENDLVKDQFLLILQLILILGSLSYVIFFFIIIAFYLRRLRLEYIQIKKAIQLIPYQRLTDDQMTIFLLKKVLEF